MRASFIQSTPVHSILFGPLWFYFVHFGPIGPIWFTLVLFSPSYPLWFYLVHIGHIRSILSTLVLFNQHQSYSIQFGHIQSIMSTSVLICPCVLIRSYLVDIGPICPIQSTLFHLVHLFPLQSIRTTLIHFGPLRSIFAHLHIWKKNMFGLRVSILYPNLFFKNIGLKLVISKILSVAFIIATLLLSHNNIAFQSTSVWLNLSESLSKP